MNEKVELFYKINALLDYANDPIGVTSWWCEPNIWFGWWAGEQVDPLTILVRYVPSLMSEKEFIKCTVKDIEDSSRGMD